MVKVGLNIVWVVSLWIPINMVRGHEFWVL